MYIYIHTTYVQRIQAAQIQIQMRKRSVSGQLVYNCIKYSICYIMCIYIYIHTYRLDVDMHT